MAHKIRRIVVCDKCGKNYAFTAPTKPGVYRIVCPQCNKETIFKVVNPQ